MSYPTDRAERVARRRQIRDRLVAEAEDKARRIGLSLVCQVGNHTPSCVGAAGCLCECHDQSEGA